MYPRKKKQKASAASGRGVRSLHYEIFGGGRGGGGSMELRRGLKQDQRCHRHDLLRRASLADHERRDGKRSDEFYKD